MKTRILFLTLLASACAKPDPEADQRVRILRAQLQQASSQIEDLRAQVHEQQEQLDLKVGACCTTGAIPDNSSEDNVSTDDDDKDTGNDISDGGSP